VHIGERLGGTERGLSNQGGQSPEGAMAQAALAVLWFASGRLLQFRFGLAGSSNKYITSALNKRTGLAAHLVRRC
jgi:hypothetical protein